MAEVTMTLEEYQDLEDKLSTLAIENHSLKKERDSFHKQRDELINDMQNVKRKAEAYDKIKEAADFEKLNDCSLYDNDSFIDRLHHVFDEMRVNHEG